MRVDDKLIELIVEKVAERLGRPAGQQEFYSSISLPPDCPSRKRFREIASTLPSAEKRGNAWVVSRKEWDLARARKHRNSIAQAPTVTPSVEELANRALREAGYRPTK